MQVNSIQSFMLSSCKPQPKISNANVSDYSDRGAQLLNVGASNVLGMAFTGKSHHTSSRALKKEIYDIYEKDYDKIDWENNDTIRPVYAKVSKVVKEGTAFVDKHPTSMLADSIGGLELLQDTLKENIIQNARADFYDYFDKDCREFDRVLGTYEKISYGDFSKEKLQDLRTKATNIAKDLSLEPTRFRPEIQEMKVEKRDIDEWLRIKAMSNKKLHDALAEDFDNVKLYDEYFKIRGLDISGLL